MKHPGLATDLSSNILALAAQGAEAGGATNVATQVMDVEHLDLADESFDAVVSRLGLMYLPHLQTALRGVRRVLKPGGRLATPSRKESM